MHYIVVRLRINMLPDAILLLHVLKALGSNAIDLCFYIKEEIW